MNIQEMATAVHHRLPIKIALLNNGYLGMVRQWQELFLERRYSHTYLANGNPDFVKLAEAYRAVGIRVDRPDQVRAALDSGAMVLAKESGRVVVPAGKAIDQMLSGMA